MHGKDSRGQLGSRGLGIVVIGSILLSGCYTYSPATLQSLRPSENVRIHLTETGTARVAEVLNDSRQTLEGELVDVSPQGVSVLVVSALLQRGTRSEALVQELLVAPEEVAGVQRRELDRFRTGMVAAAGAAVVAASIVRSWAGQRRGTTGPPTGGGEEARRPIPLDRLR